MQWLDAIAAYLPGTRIEWITMISRIFFDYVDYVD
jgi:hypothetical protein